MIVAVNFFIFFYYVGSRCEGDSAVIFLAKTEQSKRATPHAANLKDLFYNWKFIETSHLRREKDEEGE